MSTLGVVVLSLRGMQHLSECLESVRWADATLLLHAGGGKPLDGVAPFSSLVLRNLASIKELADISPEIGTDWILCLWGEERIEGELREELRALCREGLSPAPLAYRIPIRSRLMGRWVEGSLWGPSPALRLGRGSEKIISGWWHPADNRPREYPVLRRGWIGDYSASELKHGIDRVQDISKLWAERLQARGDRPSPLASVLWPLQVFIRMLFKNRAAFHGFAGLTLATLAAYATLLASAKAWEAKNVVGREKGAG